VYPGVRNTISRTLVFLSQRIVAENSTDDAENWESGYHSPFFLSISAPIGKGRGNKGWVWRGGREPIRSRLILIPAVRGNSAVADPALSEHGARARAFISRSIDA